MPTQREFDALFNPHSVAIIGASERAGSVGYKVMSNMTRSGFAGEIYPVNPKHRSVLGYACYASVADIKHTVDLAVITTPAKTVPDLVVSCGEKGIRSLIIISAGFSEMGDEGKVLQEQIIDAAARYNIRFIGPNCLGVMSTHSHLNATFDNNYALPGQLALISQSGAICASILDWAMDKEIGFSTIVSMGNSANVDFGDVLEYLAHDPKTKSILLYIEGIHDPRRFIDGLHTAASMKPVIVLKAGRHETGVRAVHSHTGALVGNDDVFTAVLSRGGAIRVKSIEQLFTAAQILSSGYRAEGNRLTIVTNGGGAGVMAADRAADLNVELSELGASVVAELNKILPPLWSHQNPIDILGDATPERYHEVVNACLQDEASDALVTILVPVAMSQPRAVAEQLTDFAQKTTKPLIACWMGEKQTRGARELFEQHQLPCFSTPEVAVEAFSYLADYYHNQQLLAQRPIAKEDVHIDDLTTAKQLIANVLAQGRTILSGMESKILLEIFGIPVVKAKPAHSVEDAVTAANQVGYPVVMKIDSPDITHKQDVNGVELNILNQEAISAAYDRIMTAVKSKRPDARISGVTIEHMYANVNYRELMIGILRDHVFGPVISFGLGGTLVEVIKDRAVELPPLNSFLAQKMIAKTRASKLLGGFRGKPPVNMEILIDILLRVSQLASELPEIVEMDINPLLLDDQSGIVVDARFVVAPSAQSMNDYAHMAIHPNSNN